MGEGNFSPLIKKLREAEARRREVERRAAHNRTLRKNKEFWDRWLYHSQPPNNLRAQIITVVRRETGFEFTPWNEDAFVWDVIERCIMAYGGYDPSKSSFTTWVIMNAKSIALNIIETSKRDLDAGTSPTGRGLAWPYGADIETPFADFTTDDEEYEYGELSFMAAEQPDKLLEIIHLWAAEAMNFSDQRAVIEAILQDEPSGGGPVPTSMALARRTDMTVSEVNKILGDLRRSLATRIHKEIQ